LRQAWPIDAGFQKALQPLLFLNCLTIKRWLLFGERSASAAPHGSGVAVDTFGVK
jgi:hypothetical protein